MLIIIKRYKIIIIVFYYGRLGGFIYDDSAATVTRSRKNIDLLFTPQSVESVFTISGQLICIAHSNKRLNYYVAHPLIPIFDFEIIRLCFFFYIIYASKFILNSLFAIFVIIHSHTNDTNYSLPYTYIMTNLKSRIYKSPDFCLKFYFKRL